MIYQWIGSLLDSPGGYPGEFSACLCRKLPSEFLIASRLQAYHPTSRALIGAIRLIHADSTKLDIVPFFEVLRYCNLHNSSGRVLEFQGGVRRVNERFGWISGFLRFSGRSYGRLRNFPMNAAARKLTSTFKCMRWMYGWNFEEHGGPFEWNCESGSWCKGLSEIKV